MNNNYILVKRLFFSITFILSCFTMNSDKVHGYNHSQGFWFIVFRMVMIFCFVFIATMINRFDYKYFEKFVPTVLIVTTGILIFDYYVTQISGSQFLYRVWWIAYIFVASFSYFCAITIRTNDEYSKVYKTFWLGFTPIYLFLTYLCFMRSPFKNVTSTNFKLGNGTFLMLKALIMNPHIDFEPPLIFFGNLLVFVPIAFILSALFKKIKGQYIFIIGLVIPIIIEGYQYLFQCGDTDIDDIVLNWTGFIMGFILYIIIKKKHLTKSS